MSKTVRRSLLAGTVLASALTLATLPAFAQSADQLNAARKWIDQEFQPSSLSKEDQMKEMEWFIKAAEPFRGWTSWWCPRPSPPMNTNRRRSLRAFTEITGIKIKHDLIQEGDVIEKLQTQMQSGRNVYDAYINDSDLIGTHFRYGQVVADGLDGGRGQGRDPADAGRERFHR